MFHRLLLSLVLLTCIIHGIAQSVVFSVHEIEVAGNNKTKEDIILRELTFEVGDLLTKEEFEREISESRNNLLKTSLFNFVTIHTLSDPASKELGIVVEVEERWYLWPYPILEHADRNFNAWLKNNYQERINYGISVTQYNFRGRNESLKVKARLGFKEQYAVKYSIPGIDKKKRLGLSTEFAYFRQKETSYALQNNKLVFIKADEYIRKILDYDITFRYRPRLNNFHFITIGYNKIAIKDTLLVLNPDYLLMDRLDSKYLNVNYSFVHNTRDYNYYPLKGNYLRFSLHDKYLINEKEHILYSMIELKKYSKVSNKLYAAAGLTGKWSVDKKQPYYMIQALGYEYNIRGYEYYVVDGLNFGLLNTSLKYEILPQKVSTLNWIPFSKFNKIHYAVYATCFYDMAYVDNKYAVENGMHNEFLYSFGLGLDFVTYYDRLIRLDLSFNREGEYGLFIHFVAPI